VNVFGHHHITHDPEFVPGTDFVEYLYETISRSPRPKIWTAPVTTESDEVEITVAIVASQRVAHRRKTRTLKPEGCGTQVSYLQRTVPG
jgi:hypothetical protein